MSKKKINIKSFYNKNSNIDYKKYHETQVKMWNSKRDKKRSPVEYEAVFNIVFPPLWARCPVSGSVFSDSRPPCREPFP